MDAIFRVVLVPALRISIDFTQNLTFEPAQVAIFPQNLTSSRLPAPDDGPVLIIAEFHVRPARRSECIDLMREARDIFLRNGASRWNLHEDLHEPNKFRIGSRGALLEATPVTERAADEERKGGHR